MPDITFVGVDASESATGDQRRTVLAVRTAELDELVPALATLFECDIRLIPAAAFPGVAEIAASELSGAKPQTFKPVGTSVGDEWVTWHPPVPAPPVPA